MKGRNTDILFFTEFDWMKVVIIVSFYWTFANLTDKLLLTTENDWFKLTEWREALPFLLLYWTRLSKSSSSTVVTWLTELEDYVLKDLLNLLNLLVTLCISVEPVCLLNFTECKEYRLLTNWFNLLTLLVALFLQWTWLMACLFVLKLTDWLPNF